MAKLGTTSTEIWREFLEPPEGLLPQLQFTLDQIGLDMNTPTYKRGPSNMIPTRIFVRSELNSY